MKTKLNVKINVYENCKENHDIGRILEKKTKLETVFIVLIAIVIYICFYCFFISEARKKGESMLVHAYLVCFFLSLLGIGTCIVMYQENKKIMTICNILKNGEALFFNYDNKQLFNVNKNNEVNYLSLPTGFEIIEKYDLKDNVVIDFSNCKIEIPYDPIGI